MSEKQAFDVIVIGGGPGGYPAAIRAAQMGKKVALIEAKELGGTCLNRGCIPSKALIACAERLQAVREATAFGIEIKELSFDFAKMAEHKDQVVAKVRKGLEGLMSANKIQLFKGFGKFISPSEVEVSGEHAALLTAPKIIIATGSEPRNIGAFPFDYKFIHDSTSLLELKKLPKKMIIIGGGVIGCEFASLYATLGVEITILEMLPSILPAEAKDVSKALFKAFQKKKIQIETSVKVEGIEVHDQGVIVKIEGGKQFSGDMALVAVGRSMNTREIGLEKAGVQVNENGSLTVNSKMETNVPGIYAIGDLASKWWLAHVATHQGIVAAKNAAGVEAHMHYEAVPSVIFTDPEIGTVGLSLEAAQEKGYEAVVGNFPFQALGKAQATLHKDGFAQVVLDKKTGQILGAQVMGFEASSLIAQMALALTNELTVECIEETIYAHPTLSEAWLQACLIATGNPIDYPPKK